MLLVLASAFFLGSKSLGSRDHILLSPLFYCLSFETSPFVTSYDSQGHGGGIRPRLHTGLNSLFSWSLLYNLGTNCIENTAPNASIVARLFVATDTCLLRHWLTLATQTTLSPLFLHVYSLPWARVCHTIAQQWPDPFVPLFWLSAVMSQYFLFTSGSHGSEYKNYCYLGCDGV
jgi:hypothetical protein